MEKSIYFVIPGEPKAKQRPRISATGRAYTPKNTVLYENMVKTSFNIKYPEFAPLCVEMEADIIAYYSIPKSISAAKKKDMVNRKIRPTKKPDLDNVAKAVLDSLNGLAYKDDAQVVSLNITKLYSETPRVVVHLQWEEKDE